MNTDHYAGKFSTEHGNKEYERMRKECKWFDPDKHFIVVLGDDSGNWWKFVGAGSTANTVKPALREGYKLVKKKGYEGLSVDLLHDGRCHSYKL